VEIAPNYRRASSQAIPERGIVCGKSVDAGVFDAYPTSSIMVLMKSMQNPTMFAVTIEKQSGSVHTKMNTLCLKAEL